MKKILFFIDPQWVFGKIHNELIKVLYPDFYCDLKPWSVSMTLQEAELFKDKYDLFVSTPEGCFVLNASYNIGLNKMVAVVHGDYDVYSVMAKWSEINDKFNSLGGYAVIWPNGQNISISHGVNRIPSIVPVGLFTENYELQEIREPKVCGYFGKYTRMDRGVDIKRGDLVQSICTRTGVTIKKHEDLNFLIADQLYKRVDFVMFASLIEGNPYPALEAFASGIPVIGTNTGVFPEYAKTGAGVILPFEKEKFVEGAIAVIDNWKENPKRFVEACLAAREVRQIIDWRTVRQSWLDLFNKALQGNEP